MRSIEIPAERLAQVGLTLRRAANEFHGALAREPNSVHADAWRATAKWFDEAANEMIDAQNGTGALLKFTT